MGIWGFLVGLALISFETKNSDGFEAWLEAQKVQMLQDLIKNLNTSGIAPGVVIASPSKANPDYFYDWTRDGAIVMLEMVSLYANEADPATKASYLKRLLDYVDAARLKQLTPNKSGGVGDKGNGEPKWNTDLSAFNLDWGRPQNDGPALRARTLIEFAFVLQREGRMDLVRKLYDGKLPAESVIKADLEFISHRWREPSFEVWEEVNGEHFSTRMQTRRALRLGAELAKSLNDEGAANWYEKQAEEIKLELEKHWREDLKYLIQTVNRVEGVPYKDSNLDSAVLIAALDENIDSAFKIHDDKILATAEALRVRMQAAYSINQMDKDHYGESMNTALGRYIEDRYDGYSTQNRGNPWYLITSMGAQLSYQVASSWIEQGSLTVTELNLPFLRGWLDLKNISLIPGETIIVSDNRFQIIMKSALEAGNAFLRRWRYHSGLQNNPHEQMNRESGHRQGAPELTWNCASFLSTIKARDKLKSKLNQ